MVCPLIQELSIEARKTTQLAISLGWAGRPIGLVNSFWAFSFIVAGINGVHTTIVSTAQISLGVYAYLALGRQR
jgi:hypothetical protein